MNNHDVEVKILGLLKSMWPKATKELQLETDLFEANILDSFGILEFIGALDNEFDIEISNDDLVPQNLWSVAAAAKTVQKYLPIRSC